jgi:uncharacterized protein YbaR (Trm112 family)
MPTDFVCKRCELRFSAGWYHHPDFRSGYGSRTLLVCAECGTQHAIEWAVPDRGPPFYTLHRLIVESVPADAVGTVCRLLRRRRDVKLADALTIARNPPFVLLEQEIEARIAEIRDELAGLGVSTRTELVERSANPSFGPIQAHRLLYHVSPTFGKTKQEWVVLDGAIAQTEESQALRQSLICQHCHAQGTLDSDIEETFACPSCKEQQLLVESEWIT